MTATVVNVPLDTPIVRGEQEIASITLRKPTAGELRGLNVRDLVQADTDALIVLLPRISSPPITEAEAAAMDVSDFVECANQVSGFLPQRAQRTASPAE